MISLLPKLLAMFDCDVQQFLISGRQNGKGYYIYEKGSKPKPDPSVLPIIEESRKVANIMPGRQVLDSALKDGFISFVI